MWNRFRLVFLLSLFAEVWAGLEGRPSLDISAHDESNSTLRRIQTRTGAVYSTQVFPQNSANIDSYLKTHFLSPYDLSSLENSDPFLNNEIIQWNDSLRRNSFYLSPKALIGFQQSDEKDSIGSSLHVGIGARISGKLGNRLTYFTEAKVFTEKTNRDQFGHQFSPDFGETYSVEKGSGDSLLNTRTYN